MHVPERNQRIQGGDIGISKAIQRSHDEIVAQPQYLELTDKDFFIHQHRAFEENYETSKCSVRSVYYPKVPRDCRRSIQLRLPAHQDFGTINLIRQSAEGGGLQAKLYNGKWVDVPHIENAFVLLAARCLEMYSGGNIPAVVS
jgi:isopenicillin N synthase-like dioxygenase